MCDPSSMDARTVEKSARVYMMIVKQMTYPHVRGAARTWSGARPGAAQMQDHGFGGAVSIPGVGVFGRCS